MGAAVQRIDRHLADACPAVRAYLYESGYLRQVSMSAFLAWDGQESEARVERVDFFLALELKALDLPACDPRPVADVVHL